MALYHCSIKPVSRAKGRAATAAAAYRSGSRIRDERTGEVFDFSRKRGVEHTEIVLPLAAVQRDIHWARDRLALWNAAELAEVRKDARVAREYELALPHELDRTDRVALARTFSQEIADRFGVAADFAIHRPHRDGDQRNHHVHLLTTTRQVEATGLGAKATFEWSNTDRARRGLAPSSDEVAVIRRRWGELTNGFLHERGVAARVDHRSLKEQGIDREPTTHLGPAVMGMQRRGIETEVGRRVAWQQQRAAQERLARAAEEGRLERASADIQKSIVEVTSGLTAARRERGPLEHRARPSPQEISRTAIENWKTVRDGLARARAFEQLPQDKVLEKHPELQSTYDGWSVFEREAAARFKNDAPSYERHISAGRRNLVARMEQSLPFDPRDLSNEAIAERLRREVEERKAQQTRRQELDRDGPEFGM